MEREESKVNESYQEGFRNGEELKNLQPDYEFMDEQDDGGDRRNKSNRIVIFALFVVVGLLSVNLFQQRKLTDLREREANIQAQIILIQEENLRKYGISPDMIPELGELREIWFNDYSSESAKMYSEALEYILDYLEENNGFYTPPESNDSSDPIVIAL